MQAVVVREFGDPGVLHLEDVPDPQLAAPDEVLVEVRAVGVNPFETYIRAGAYANLPEPPYTPGCDAGGIVLQTGENVSGVRTGDRVWTTDSLDGAYAQRTRCREADLHALPTHVSFAQGAALGVPYTTAWYALFTRGRIEPPQTVLVHGASGGVGLAIVQLAAARGIEIIATAGSEEGRRLTLAQGATHSLDHGDPAHYDQVLEITRGRGVDAVIEMKAHVNLGDDLPVLSARGRVVVVGCRGTIEIAPRDLMARDAEVVGVMTSNASARETAGIHAAIAAGLASGTLSPVVGTELPLAEAPRAHREVMEGPHLGKIALVP
jgi:NADPH2:quinone reductase